MWPRITESANPSRPTKTNAKSCAIDPLTHFRRRSPQQIPQHGHFRRNPGVQRRIHIRREKRRMIRRQHRPGSLGLRELLRVRSAQTEIETRNPLLHEERKILRRRDRLFHHNVLFA
jgi:hypothetical protein